MSWPNSPVNGQQTTINGITFQWDAGNSVWNRITVSMQVPTYNAANTVLYPTQSNITGLGVLTSLNVSGNTLLTGNLTVTGTTEYFNTTSFKVQDAIIELGGGANGAALSSNDGYDRGTVLHYYTTKTVDAFMGWDNSNAEFAFGSNVSVTGEVVTFNTFGNARASYFLGNGSQLTGTIGNANYAAYAGTVTTAAQPNITSVGTLASLTVTGNISTSTGYFLGNGSQLTGLPASYSNSNVQSYLPTYSGLIGGTLSTGAQPNVTSVGTLTSLNISGNLTSTGGWTATGQNTEVLYPQSINAATLTYNLNNGTTFFHSTNASGANWTPNFTNVPTTDNRTIIITIIVSQGGTPYVPSGIQIEGVSYNAFLRWNYGAAPTGTASYTDVFSYCLVRSSGSWTTIMGSYSTFG